MEEALHHSDDDSISFTHRGTELYRYCLGAGGNPRESPRPFFHPIRTLGGNIVTGYRPADHRWHKGMSMTCAELNGYTFWGGPTYVRDSGYVMLENHGEQVHREWIKSDLPRRIEERLDWVAGDGAVMIEEERTIAVADVDAKSGWWALRLTFLLRNAARATLHFGSPTTNGRPNAGYGGLFWRAPRSFREGAVFSERNNTADDIMGTTSRYVVFSGPHDEVDESSTLVFVDSGSNPRHPTKWFARTDPDPYLSASFMFDEVFDLEAGESAAFSYVVGIADGEVRDSRGAGELADRAVQYE